MNLEKFLLAVWIINAITGVAVLYIEYRRKHPKLCDCCKHLRRKNGLFALWSYRYHCEIHDKFDIQPKYCRAWEAREQKDGDNNAD